MPVFPPANALGASRSSLATRIMVSPSYQKGTSNNFPRLYPQGPMRTLRGRQSEGGFEK